VFETSSKACSNLREISKATAEVSPSTRSVRLLSMHRNRVGFEGLLAEASRVERRYAGLVKTAGEFADSGNSRLAKIDSSLY
jgi:hypothetical protein